jgi:hypothetical protein
MNKAQKIKQIFGDKATAFVMMHIEECMYQPGTLGYNYWIEILEQLNNEQ